MKKTVLPLWVLLAGLLSGCQNVHPWNAAYYHQPALHTPLLYDYNNLLLHTNDVYFELSKTFVTSSQIYSTNIVPKDSISQIDTNSQPPGGQAKGSDQMAANAFVNTNTEEGLITTNTSYKSVIVTNTYYYLALVVSNKLVDYPLVTSLEVVSNGNGAIKVAKTGPVKELNNDYQDIGGNIKASFQIESDQDSSEEFGKFFSSCFYVGQISIHNSDPSKTFLADSSSLWVMTSFYLKEKDWESGGTLLQDNVRRRYGEEFIRMPRHPLIYSDILAIFEYEQKADPRQQISDYMDSAGAIASGVALFVPGALFGKGVNFAVGIVKPEIQKRILWDLLEYHANFVARGLPETVKVPPNSGVNGLVFFPRRGIPGYVDGYEVYISSFNSKQTALVTGALVSDGSLAQSATLPVNTEATIINSSNSNKVDTATPPQPKQGGTTNAPAHTQ